ncbi:ribosome silencing factor [Desulfotignum phosphitoxidans]|uniref:Ribosomal silencing factor RsfS n=1 Tax=Desulfotignum phosphitoxidans DSM 13687 TaxID=1286635 RepID=S0G0V3_9BACT|nr:ribosome silencing factor [Desulfotignum phosphitoxidans]EMS81003.1 putative glycerol-3-phosphate cytidyltransferase TagD [Desulfotignum phosphitoxidans DSM 13687]
MTDPSEELTPYLSVVFGRKPRSVTAIDVRSLTSYTDTLIIVEAGSHRQVTSLAENIVTGLKAKNILSLGTEGIKEGEWALLDYGSPIIHIFETKAKAFYDLEGLWSDAPRLDLSGFETALKSPKDPS